MADDLLGVIVAGARPLDSILAEDDAALTPFAGRYRFVDFALAALADAGVAATYVLAPPGADALAGHLAGGIVAAARRRPHLHPVALPADGPPAARLDAVLPACRALAQRHRASAVVVLVADHVVRLDVRALAAARARHGADVALAALPIAASDAGGRTVLEPGGDGRVGRLGQASARTGGFLFSWAGDAVVGVGALADARPRRTGTLDALLAARRAVALDVTDCAGDRIPYWHVPTSVEDYYAAQMEACSPRSPLDLHDPVWALPAVSSHRPPARVVADAVGRVGQALNAIVCDGAVVRGGFVANSVVGPGAIVESGAEVEDAILLAGCRIGRHARVRRAVVGAGAVVEDGVEIGYGADVAGARARASGLTLVPAATTPLAVAANGR